MLTSFSSEDSEYLTNYVIDNKNEYLCNSAPVKYSHKKKIRLTIDTQKDFKKVSTFLNRMKDKEKLFNYNMNDIIKFFKEDKIKKNIKKDLKINTKKNWSKLIN